MQLGREVEINFLAFFTDTTILFFMIFLYSPFLFLVLLFSFPCFSVSLGLIYLLLSDFSSHNLIVLYTILRQTSAETALHYVTSG